MTKNIADAESKYLELRSSEDLWPSIAQSDRLYAWWHASTRSYNILFVRGTDTHCQHRAFREFGSSIIITPHDLTMTEPHTARLQLLAHQVAPNAVPDFKYLPENAPFDAFRPLKVQFNSLLSSETELTRARLSLLEQELQEFLLQYCYQERFQIFHTQYMRRMPQLFVNPVFNG